MKHTPIRLGPLALLLTVISICLTVLAILTITTAQADRRMSERYADAVEQRYALEAEGQRLLRDLREDPGRAASLERGEDGLLRTELRRDDFTLRIALREDGDGYTVVSWRQAREWEIAEEPIHIWTGH